MKIGGVDIKRWGLTLIKSEGLLSFPSRKEPLLYQWGDVVEPLTDREDLFFEPNSFSLELFYEKPQEVNEQEPSASLFSLLDHLSREGSSYIEIESAYKKSQVKIVQIKQVKTFGSDLGRFTMELRAARSLEVPSFPSGLKVSDTEGLRVEGYHLEENTGWILSEFKEVKDIPPLGQSAASIYKGSELSVFRELKKLTLELYGFYESERSLAARVDLLTSMLASPGVKNISYEGFLYGAYLSSGIKVTLLRETAASCQITLDVVDVIKRE